MSKHQNDNRSNQLNPNNINYWKSRGYTQIPDHPFDVAKSFKKQWSKHELDNRANQLNPQHPAYWKSRGFL
ncbi:MAG: hypothetical protein N3F09_08015 [Bacteroidia bacterium]|nr:hypothetical protein [Bacteroidia bacterium]